MHTFIGKNGTIFNYNSDFSGTVIISHGGLSTSTHINIHIDGDDILQFIAEIVRIKKIARLEMMTTHELLRL